MFDSNISAPHIMMDVAPVALEEYQLAHADYVLYTSTPPPPARLAKRVRYLFINFSKSHRFENGSDTMLLGRWSGCQEVPELSDTVPYDAFKADVCALGCVYYDQILVVRTSTSSSQQSNSD